MLLLLFLLVGNLSCQACVELGAGEVPASQFVMADSSACLRSRACELFEGCVHGGDSFGGDSSCLVAAAYLNIAVRHFDDSHHFVHSGGDTAAL